MTPEAAAEFVLGQTAISRAPLVPELALHLASEITPIWQASEQSLAREGVEPPYWAFAWPGGQALARFVLDDPPRVAGRRVLDLAAGGGIAGIAAARAGAAVTAAEIDPLAAAAIRANAALNGVEITVALGDPLRHPAETEVILAGDVCSEARMTARVVPWLREAASRGLAVLLADPGRAYLPGEGLEPLVRYQVPVTRELEDRLVRETTVYRVLP